MKVRGKGRSKVRDPVGPQVLPTETPITLEGWRPEPWPDSLFSGRSTDSRRHIRIRSTNRGGYWVKEVYIFLFLQWDSSNLPRLPVCRPQVWRQTVGKWWIHRNRFNIFEKYGAKRIRHVTSIIIVDGYIVLRNVFSDVSSTVIIKVNCINYLTSDPLLCIERILVCLLESVLGPKTENQITILVTYTRTHVRTYRCLYLYIRPYLLCLYPYLYL